MQFVSPCSFYRLCRTRVSRVSATSMLVATALAFVVGCSSAATNDNELDPVSKKEAASGYASGKYDGIDLCELWNWYGDEVCDAFCPEPDPDCDSGDDDDDGGTGNSLCSAPDLALPATGEFVLDTIVVASDELIRDLDVSIQAEYENVDETEFFLRHEETDTWVRLFYTERCDGSDIDAVFDDEAFTFASRACDETSPAVSGRLYPAPLYGGGLEQFEAQALSGTWTLSFRYVGRDVSGAAGTLEEWCLIPGPKGFRVSAPWAWPPPGGMACVGGNSEDIALPVHRDQGFHDSITLTYSDLPLGFSGTFAENPVPPSSDNIVARLQLADSVGAGTYVIKVRASAPGLPVREVPIDVTVLNDAPPYAPELDLPRHGATNVSRTSPSFWWVTSLTESSTFELGRDPSFANIDFFTETEDEYVFWTLTGEGPLLPLTAYYWRVTAHNVCGSATSPLFGFTTGE